MSFISISETNRKKLRGALPLAAGFAVAFLLAILLWIGFGERLQFTPRLEPDYERTVAETGRPASAARPMPQLDPIPEDLQHLFAINPDARMFVARYPTHHLKHDEIDLSALQGLGTVPHLYQWDVRWGYETYNENFFALSGCGPTCLSMVDIYLTGRTDHTPLWMAQYAESNGYNEIGSGTKWTLFSEGSAPLGLRAEGITLSFDFFYQTLTSGAPIVCAMFPGDFTQHGHYLVLTGMDAAGNITVNDPNSRIRSARIWTFDELRPQIRGGWVFSSEDALSTPQPDIG